MADLFKIDRRSKGYKLARGDLSHAIVMFCEALRDIHANRKYSVAPQGAPWAAPRVLRPWQPFEYAGFALTQADIACDNAANALERCGMAKQRDNVEESARRIALALERIADALEDGDLLPDQRGAKRPLARLCELVNSIDDSLAAISANSQRGDL